MELHIYIHLYYIIQEVNHHGKNFTTVCKKSVTAIVCKISYDKIYSSDGLIVHSF